MMSYWKSQCKAIRATKCAFKAKPHVPDDYRYIKSRLKTMTKMDEDSEPAIASRADACVVRRAREVIDSTEVVA